MFKRLKKIKILPNKLRTKPLGLLLLFCLLAWANQLHIIQAPIVHAESMWPENQIPSSDGDVFIWPENQTQSSDGDMFNDKIELMNIYLKILYIILRPLLAIAGLALDNTLVYWTIFHLDVPLWKIRNIMKNFANFALWFVVLRTILKSIFNFKKEEVTKKPLKVIWFALVAGILIQMSWFIVGAVIDISTIATYSVGGIPMTVLKDNDLWKKPILWLHTNFQLWEVESIIEKEDDFQIRYSYGKYKKISKCKFDDNWVYIIWREKGSKEFEHDLGESNLTSVKINWVTSDITAKKEMCVLRGSKVAVYYEFPSVREASTETNDDEYHNILGNITNNSPDRTDREEKGLVIDFKNAPSWLGIDAGDILLWEQAEKWALTLSSMLERMKWLTWPLITIYVSITNFAEMSDIDPSGRQVGGMYVETLVKTIFALALIIPLFLLAILLLARVWVLWLVIAFSPFLILYRLLKGVLDIKIEALDSLPIELKDLMGIVFSPVIIVFSLSVSLIFMTILTETLQDVGQRDEFYNAMNVMEDEDTNSLNLLNRDISFGIQDANNSSGRWDVMTTFSRFLVQLFAIGLMRAILMWAIKANKLWKGMMDWTFKGMDSWLKDALLTVPLFNVWSEKTWIWLWAVWNVLPGAPAEAISNLWRAQSSAFSKAILGDDSWSAPNLTTQQIENLVRARMQGWTEFADKLKDFNITEDEFFASHSTEYQDIVSDMYSESPSKFKDKKMRNKDQLLSMDKGKAQNLIDQWLVNVNGWDTIQLSGWRLYTVHAYVWLGGKPRHKLVENTNDEFTADQINGHLTAVEEEMRENAKDDNHNKTQEEIDEYIEEEIQKMRDKYEADFAANDQNDDQDDDT